VKTHRRTWTLTIDGREREIVIEYAGLSGWMSMFVDGQRVERRWREWQTVWGGAMVDHHLDGHHLRARITQPFGAQTYAFALSVDGMIQPGSDDLQSRGGVRRSTVIALGGLALTVDLSEC
jgi:hypothetical protein